jgi:hypothetical protein
MKKETVFILFIINTKKAIIPIRNDIGCSKNEIIDLK